MGCASPAPATDAGGGDTSAQQDALPLVDLPPPVDKKLIWVLIHPTNAPVDGDGIHAYDPQLRRSVRRFPPPPGARFAGGLAFDGISLWATATKDDKGLVYEIDPHNGNVRSSFPISSKHSQGLAIDGGHIWIGTEQFATKQSLIRSTWDGDVVSQLPIGKAVVNDLTAAKGMLYYIVNGPNDPIYRMDPKTGDQRVLVQTGIVAPYSLTYDGKHLVVVEDTGFGGSSTNNVMRRYDPNTGTLVSSEDLLLKGWVYAIAFAADSGPIIK